MGSRESIGHGADLTENDERDFELIELSFTFYTDSKILGLRIVKLRIFTNSEILTISYFEVVKFYAVLATY